MPYWICLGCGEMLINPELETDMDIIWLCDDCGALLNVQKGFDESREEWICVPEGNDHKTSSGFWEDSTRLPEYYDGTYNYLKSLGLEEID